MITLTMITLSMMFAKSITLFLALFYSISLLGSFINFIVKGMKGISNSVPTAYLIVPCFLWAVFYFLTL